MSEALHSSTGNEPEKRRNRWLRRRWDALYKSVDDADSTELVRAVLALLLVLVLVVLQFFPSGQTQLMTAAETLAISVVAFYFGLHGSGASTSASPTDDTSDVGQVT